MGWISDRSYGTYSYLMLAEIPSGLCTLPTITPLSSCIALGARRALGAPAPSSFSTRAVHLASPKYLSTAAAKRRGLFEAKWTCSSKPYERLGHVVDGLHKEKACPHSLVALPFIMHDLVFRWLSQVLVPVRPTDSFSSTRSVHASCQTWIPS